jgi:nucleoid-associated protein YgaU
MKLRVLNRLKGQVVCLLAAAALVSIQAGCGSTSDEETEQEVGLETSDANAEGFENAENAENANVATDGANESNNFEGTNEFANESGSENAFNNFESNGEGAADASLNAEVSNETADLINESAGDAFEAPANDPNATANVGADPFAANATTAEPIAATDTTADPFAAPAAEGQDPVVASSPAPQESAVNLPSQGYVPEDGARMAYMIQVGDTLASISQKIYGSNGRWRQLAEENNLSNPNLIYVGDVLYYSLNADSRKFAESYETSPRTTVTVQAGDSLSSIAARVYGTEGAWRTLWKDNPSIQDPNQLTVGMVLSYRSGGSYAFAGDQGAEGVLTSALDL